MHTWRAIMGQELLIKAGKWLWDTYGKDVLDKTFKDVKNKWVSFNWPHAEAQYRSRMRELYGITKVLNRDIKIQNLYTDVFVQDKISSDLNYEAQEIQAHLINKKLYSIQLSRKPIKQVALQNSRLFILGKPGAGKTTFLKYLTLQACMGNVGKTPIFVALKEWSDARIGIIEFINKQFEICSFPDSILFVEQLLSKGNAMVLFDGLDEVGIKNREFIIGQLEWFSKRYINTPIYISCRIGSIDQVFERYNYVEIADFDEKQINVFARKWFDGDRKKMESFLSKLGTPDNQGLRELAQTPLLLALLCIVFEEILEFPKKKIDLYARAVDILLEKWDTKRGIARDNEYFTLSRRRKENLLSYLAAVNFQAGEYVFEKEILIRQVDKFFSQLPKDESISANGELVLRTIQEHHGLIVERSRDFFSFSHLTVQEYFTARYIVGNAANGSIKGLITNYWNNDQWNEIFKMVFGMLDEGTEPIRYFINHLNSVLKEEANLGLLFRWSNEKALKSNWDNLIGRCLYSFLGLIIIGSRVPDCSSYAARSRDKIQSFSYLFNDTKDARLIFNQLSDIALESSQKKRINLAQIRRISTQMGAPILSEDLTLNWDFKRNDLTLLEDYLQACKLLIDCLNTTRIINREDIFGRIFSI